MADSFFSADYHFFHANVIKYDNRPFKDVYEMNDEIIRRHNERVKDTDTVYFLGDYGFWATQNRAFRGEGQPYNPDVILNKMNGKHWCFLKGNHDKSSNKFKPKMEMCVLNQNRLRIQLLHDPMYAKVDYDLILCGHVHTKFKLKELHYCGEIRLIINVGCSVWNYRPVKLEEIISIYHRWLNERKKIKRWEQPKILTELNKGTLHGETRKDSN